MKCGSMNVLAARAGQIGRILALGMLLSAAHAGPPDSAPSGDRPTTSWPTFNGDDSGERFSPLRQIDTSNVASLQLQWSYRITDVGAQRGAPVPVIKSTPLLVNGVLYFTIPNNIYAVDARSGTRLWSYSWVDEGGHLVGNRGLGMYEHRKVRRKGASSRWRVAFNRSMISALCSLTAQAGPM